MTTTALAPKDYEGLLENRRDRLEQLLAGSGIDPDRFIGMTVQTIARNPKLLAPDIDRDSVLLAILSVAELGLVPSGPQGGAWLVPYRVQGGKKVVQHIIDWRGFIKMAFRSGQLRSAWAYPVYGNEPFEVVLGSTPSVRHTALPEAERGDTITHYYAVAHLSTGDRLFEVMTAAEVDAIRRRSWAAEDGPWVTDPIEMGRKTVIRRLFKYLPVAVTPQLAQALDNEDAWEDALRVPAESVQPVSARRQRLLAHMTGEDAEAVPAAPETPEGTPAPEAAEAASPEGEAHP